MSFDFGSNQESDPTADFLARERAAAGALQGDADLFGGSHAAGSGVNSMSALQGQSGTAGAAAGDRDFESSAANFPALDGDGLNGLGSGSTGAPAAPAASGGFGAFDDDDDFLGGASTTAPPPAAAAAAASSANPELDQFERNFPELDEPVDEPPPPSASYAAPASNGFMAAPIGSNISQPPPSANQYAADPYSVRDADGQEPEPVRQWREKQEQDIATREAAAERKKGETISKAEQEIDNFYADYNKKKEKTIAANKEEEAAFKAQRQAELAEGTTWSRVTKLVDLQNSQSKTIARGGPGASDLTRMKEILLSLRREGETAPGASGY